MKRGILKVFILIALSVLVLGCAQEAQKEVTTTTPTAAKAEWVPEKPIQVIVPYKAGGGTDSYARIVAQCWEKYIPGDQPVVIINKPGGGGAIGTTDVYTAKPDGYTIGLIIPNQMILNQLTSDTVFDVRKFEFLGGPSVYTRTIFVNPKTVPEIDTWDELLERIYELRIATYGYGSTAHIATILQGKLSGQYDPQKLHFIHYEGTSGIVAAFERGEADVYWGAAEAHKIYADQGIFRPILVLSTERHPLLPDVPSAAEVGIPNAENISLALWDPKAFVAPPRTPENVVNTLTDTLWKAMNDPECKAAAEKAKRPITPITREKLEEFIDKAFETWSKQEDILELIKGG